MEILSPGFGRAYYGVVSSLPELNFDQKSTDNLVHLVKTFRHLLSDQDVRVLFCIYAEHDVKNILAALADLNIGEAPLAAYSKLEWYAFLQERIDPFGFLPDFQLWPFQENRMEQWVAFLATLNHEIACKINHPWLLQYMSAMQFLSSTKWNLLNPLEATGLTDNPHKPIETSSADFNPELWNNLLNADSPALIEQFSDRCLWEWTLEQSKFQHFENVYLFGYAARQILLSRWNTWTNLSTEINFVSHLKNLIPN